MAWVQVGDGPPTCGYRLHTQFEILKGIPHRIDATSANPKGPDGERAVLEQTLEPDRLYVTDRGYQKWNLFNSIVAKRSSYHPVRMVIVQGTPHTSRGRNAGRKYSSTGPSSDGLIRLVTDMLDVPADLIAQIYHLRWLIELFLPLLADRHHS